MSIPMPHLPTRRDSDGVGPLAARLAGNRADAEGMADWEWIASRIADCDPGLRSQESAVRRRDEALASAERVMELRSQSR